MIRDQVALLQRAANAQGSPLKFIDGIPHYYRRLSYEYALPHPATFRLHRGIPIPNGHELRPARWADIDSIVELHDGAAEAAEVAACRREEHWRWILGDTRGDEHALVATCNGEVVAFARALVEEEPDLG